MINKLPWIVDVSRYQSIFDPPQPTKNIDWKKMYDYCGYNGKFGCWIIPIEEAKEGE